MRKALLLLAAALASPVFAAAPGPLAPPPPMPASAAPATQFIGTALNVVDLDREIGFYTRGLGFKLAATMPGATRTETILALPGGAAQPSLLLMHDITAAAPKAITHGDGFSRLVLRVADLDALAQHLSQLGYEHGAIRTGGQGYRVLIMTDPEGYRLEIVQPGSPRAGS